ncbi:MAG: Gfo/Idh/MocA family protein [bacterium]
MTDIGFIGVGNMGRNQVDAFRQLDDCRITAAADSSPASLEKFSELCPDAATFADHKALLADGSIDAVVVAVPTALHASTVLDVLASGRSVLVEKPMARTVEQCQQMIDAADKADRLLMVGHCRRFDNDWGTLASAYRDGRLGDPVLWRHVMAGVGPGGWFRDEQLGGGPLMDGAIHNQDFANLLFGEPASVVGNAIKFDPNCTGIDTGSVIIRYHNGCQLLLSWSWAVRGQRLHDVLGPQGTFVFGPGDMTPPEGCGGHTLIDSDGSEHLLTFERRSMFVAQARHFLDCLQGKTTCASPGTEAIKAVALAETVLAAARTGEVCEVDAVRV